MSKITTLNFGEHFIERLVQYLDEQYAAKGRDLSRIAIVFGGKRPALFVKRELSQKMKNSFYPPQFFAIDEFISTIIHKHETFQHSHDLEQSYFLYHLAKTHCPQILKGRETFAQFLPWTRELLSFIDQLDLENVPDEKLRNIEANAQIGYAVPEDINRLLESIVVLRTAYHVHMQKTKTYSRGFQYRRAAEIIAEIDLPEFDQIIFCNFFYFNHSEGAIVKNLYDRDKARLILQGDENRWPTLKRMSRLLGEPIVEHQPRPLNFQLKLYSAFDGHSQVAMAREILKDTAQLDKTVIVLPDPSNIIPLIAEIDPLVKDFNISMGYPLKRSSLFSLLDFIFKAQLSIGEHGPLTKDFVADARLNYYTRDYLRVLRHPLMKNLDFGQGSSVSRVLIHKIEEMITGITFGALSGNIFITLPELLAADDIFVQTQETLSGMGIKVTPEELKKVLTTIHAVAFGQWEKINTFHDFAAGLDQFLKVMLEKSFLAAYPLNLKIADKILLLKEEMESVSFEHEAFPKEDIFKIFEANIEREIVAFTGSPLKGLQILGLFETRALNFENVIVLDANEGVLPHLNVYEPLIPREVMITLNLDRLEQDEEIQRYQFMRLISGAKTVHLIYEESAKKEKSRFVEELVWEEEKKKEKLACVPVIFPSFSVNVSARATEVKKTAAMIDFLKNYRYSASSVNTYLRSPLEFYYSYVLGLREKEDLLEEPENKQVGTFVHDLLEETFKNFIGKKPVIDAKFKMYFQKVLNDRFAAVFGKGHQSDAYLLKTVLDVRLGRFLEEEASDHRGVEEILFIEKKFEDQIALSSGKMNFSYRVDRVDRMRDGTIMILDYKTGGVDPMPRAIEMIENMEMSRENIRDKVISFQIPLYFNYLDKTFPGQPINAAYYNLRTMEVNPFLDAKMTFDRQRINAAFIKALDFIMSEILNPEIPFQEAPWQREVVNKP